MWINIFLILLLLGIAYQDFTTRSVHILLFAVLLILSVWYSFIYQKWSQLLGGWIFNFIFIAFQLAIVFLYIKMKFGWDKKIINNYLGIGDLVFFLPLVLILPPVNFLAFYISSLIGILLLTLLANMFFGKKIETIPLAGGQALFLALILSYCIWQNVNLYHQEWFYLLRIET